jgi:DNA-binding transcriptional regulator YhcF (GntR family)
MSFQAMTWAIGHKIPALQKLVLLMLANRSNHETGKCIPKIKTLAEECGMSERSVQRAIQELGEAGLLKTVHRSHEGVQLSNQYNLCLWIRGELEFNTAPLVTNCHPMVSDSHPGESEWRTEPGIEPGKEPTPQAPKGAGADGFAEFWAIYPKKVGKDAAEKSWNRKVKTKATAEEVMTALKAHTKNEAWARDGGQYIPNPATWLNQGRWKDELAGEIAGSQDWSKGAV